jgi:hypothetical protein
MNDADTLKKALGNLLKACLENPEATSEIIDILLSPQTPERKAATVSAKDTIKTTLNWLARKQWIKKELLEAKPPVPMNGGIWEPPKEYVWRITKPAAFIYRALMEAAEKGEIPLEKDADVIKNFMINNLKTNDDGEITSGSLTKADKRRQTPTK